jgi:hypothetical protein
MLPVYKAIAVNQEAIHSGTTKPCLMTLADNNGNIIGDYVVKVFKPINLEQGKNTSKEVYGNILAQEFDLSVPEAVLVKVSQDIINILLDSGKYDGFNLSAGVYFGTAYIENALDYSSAVNPRLEDWELETIFAFDVLILNIDRHKGKPNLFFKDGDVQLIDHELSLNEATLNEPFPEMVLNKAKYWQFVEINKPDFVRKHLFLEELRRKNESNPINFDTFEGYLRLLDVNVLDAYESFLQIHGIQNENFYKIKQYLKGVKDNSGLFIQLLKDLI